MPCFTGEKFFGGTVDGTVQRQLAAAGFHLPYMGLYRSLFLHKSGKEGLAKKDPGWKSLLRLTSWNSTSRD
jgi:hypothetical protein